MELILVGVGVGILLLALALARTIYLVVGSAVGNLFDWMIHTFGNEESSRGDPGSKENDL